MPSVYYFMLAKVPGLCNWVRLFLVFLFCFYGKFRCYPVYYFLFVRVASMVLWQSALQAITIGIYFFLSGFYATLWLPFFSPCVLPLIFLIFTFFDIEQVGLVPPRYMFID